MQPTAWQDNKNNLPSTCSNSAFWSWNKSDCLFIKTVKDPIADSHFHPATVSLTRTLAPLSRAHECSAPLTLPRVISPLPTEAIHATAIALALSDAAEASCCSHFHTRIHACELWTGNYRANASSSARLHVSLLPL